jgi:hypothetical protein
MEVSQDDWYQESAQRPHLQGVSQNDIETDHQVELYLNANEGRDELDRIHQMRLRDDLSQASGDNLQAGGEITFPLDDSELSNYGARLSFGDLSAASELSNFNGNLAQDLNSNPDNSQNIPYTRFHTPCGYNGCGRIFSRPADAKRHRRTHARAQYACEVPGCHRTFYRVDKLRDHASLRHSRSIHSMRDCPQESGYALPDHAALDKHSRKQHEETPDPCSVASVGSRYELEDQAALDMHSQEPDEEISDLRSVASLESFRDSAIGSSVHGVIQAAKDEILWTIKSDGHFLSLLSGISAKVEKVRFTRNIARLILAFANDLGETVTGSRERDVVKILKSHASWFAARLFDLFDPEKELHVDRRALKTNQQTEKFFLLERYLASPLPPCECLPVQDIDDQYEGVEPHDDSMDINYENFPNLERIKSFIIGGIAFERLRENIVNFGRHKQTGSQGPQLLGPRSPSELDDVSMETDTTDITEPDLGTEDTDCSSDDLPYDAELFAAAEERILDPRGYFAKLEDLERRVFRNSLTFIHQTSISKGSAQDERLLCMPESIYIHPLSGSFMDTIKETRSGRLLRVLESYNIIRQAASSLIVLKENGYCTSFFPILVADNKRSSVVRIVPVEIQTILDLAESFIGLFQSIVVMMSERSAEEPHFIDGIHALLKKREAESPITEKCLHLLVHMGFLTSPVNVHPDHIPLWNLTAQTIDLAVLSYAGAHIERFDKKFLEQEVESIILPRRFTYHDEVLSSICRSMPDCACLTARLSRRRLQCMDAFLGSEMPWVFHCEGSLQLPSERLYLSTSVETLTDLWGPCWKILSHPSSNEIKQYDIGNGMILPWTMDDPSLEISTQIDPPEVFCHWIPSKAWNENEVQRCQIGLKRCHFLPTDTLLIGAVYDSGLQVNNKCILSLARLLDIKSKLADQNALRHTNVSRSKRYIDSYTAQIQVSPISFVSGAAQANYKRRKGETMKDALLDNWRHDNWNPLYLEFYGGVEVSLCSRNARRKRLLGILSSDTMVNYLNAISFSWVSERCRIAYLKALRSPKTFRPFWQNHPEWRPNVANAISKCFDALEETGIDEDSYELRAFWVESFDDEGDSDGEPDDASVGQPSGVNNSPMQATASIPSTPDCITTTNDLRCFEEWIVTLFRSEHTWTGLLKDSERTLTMAVVGATCLEFHDKGCFGRKCSRPPSANWKGYPILQTSLWINEILATSSQLKQEQVGAGRKMIWSSSELKKGATLPLGDNGNLEVVYTSSDSCPAIVEWKGVKSELLKEIKNVAINEKLLGKEGELRHEEFMSKKGTVKPLPILVLSKSTKVKFSKD